MLCLTMRVGEKIIINNEITVNLIKVIGKRAYFGINAPKSVHILR